jgi:hypothetical protein
VGPERYTRESSRDLEAPAATRGSGALTWGPLDLIVGDTLARVELPQPGVDLCEEDEAFDGVIN